MSEHLGRAATVLAWWLVLLAGYLMLISSVTAAEVVAGAVFAALAAALGAVAAASFRPARPPRGVAWRRLAWLPVDVVRDTALLLRRLAHRGAHLGHLAEVPLPDDVGASPAAGLRAYGVLVLSTSPGGYVIDVHPGREDAGRLEVHRLGGPGRAEGWLEP